MAARCTEFRNADVAYWLRSEVSASLIYVGFDPSFRHSAADFRYGGKADWSRVVGTSDADPERNTQHLLLFHSMIFVRDFPLFPKNSSRHFGQGDHGACGPQAPRHHATLHRCQRRDEARSGEGPLDEKYYRGSPHPEAERPGRF